MKTRVVGFHASPAEYEKIRRLAMATNRNITGVLKTLVAQAELAPSPDIRLGQDWQAGQAGASA